MELLVEIAFTTANSKLTRQLERKIFDLLNLNFFILFSVMQKICLFHMDFHVCRLTLIDSIGEIFSSILPNSFLKIT